MIEPRQPEPFIPVTDLWRKGQLTDQRMAAYRRLIAEGEIKILKVIHEPATGMTSVQYLSNVPEEFIHGTLRSLLPEEKQEQLAIPMEGDIQ